MHCTLVSYHDGERVVFYYTVSGTDSYTAACWALLRRKVVSVRTRANSWTAGAISGG